MNDGLRLGDAGYTEKAWDILHLDLELLLFRQIEECLALRDDMLNQIFVDPSVSDVEESNLEQGSFKRSEERRLCLGISCKREIKNWD